MYQIITISRARCVSDWPQMGESSLHNKLTEVECVVTHEARVCDPGGVCVGLELMPYVILLLWVCSHVSSRVFLQNSSDALRDATALRQTHGALTRYCSR